MASYVRLLESISCSGLLLLVLLLSAIIFIDTSQGPKQQLSDITRHTPTQVEPKILQYARSPREEFPFLLASDQSQTPAISQPFLIFPQGGYNSSQHPPDLAQKTCPSNPLVMCYYVDWAGDVLAPEKINFALFNWIDFAFAVPDEHFALTWDDKKKAPGLLKRLVTAAHAKGVKVKLSIGGWTGSKYFSTAVYSDQNRRTFADNILAAYKTYNLDGIDIDWEYPGRDGAGGNKYRSTDTANYLLFLNVLRATLPPSAVISAAVDPIPFPDSKGNPTTDLSNFARVLDWVLLMNYDVWESSSKPGPNAPLRDGCGNSTQPAANAVAAFNAWTSAKFPACQLVLGLPSYGYISTSTAQRLRTRKNSKNSLKVVNEDGQSEGQVQFRDLVKQGALVQSTSTARDGRPTASFAGGGGFQRNWDSCSDTPFLRSSTARQVITYDDLESLRMKAEFAKAVGMLGVNVFDVHGDTDNWDLTHCVRDAMGMA